MKRAYLEEFHVFFDRHLGRLVNYAYTIVRDRDDAEDIATEAMARAYASWTRLKGREHQEAWIFRTTLNLGIDHLRRRHRRRTHTGIDDGFAPIALASPMLIDTTGERATDHVELIIALDRLTQRQREAIALHYLAGFEVAEVANLMEIGPETVKTHMARGMKILRTEFGVTDMEVPQ
jgi:RNA polymerase sigma-70 factor (ECF subfamily)